jgi:hypothetical protein
MQNPLYLHALHTATGAVGFFVSRDSRGFAPVFHMGRHIEIDSRTTFETPHAEAIKRAIEHDLGAYRLTTQGDGDWFMVDRDTILDRLADWDMATGKRLHMDDVSVGDAVQIELQLADAAQKLRGTVAAIDSRARLYFVRLVTGHWQGMWARRGQIKRVVRVPAFAEAA